MYGAISAVIVAVILTLGGLLGVGAFSSPELTYATVNFDGGYKKIGVIKEERIFTKAATFLEGNIGRQGSFEEIRTYMEDILRRSAQEKNVHVDGVTLKRDFEIRMYSGIRWTGSESTFDLTTHQKTLKSSGDLKVVDVIAALNELERNAKNDREEKAAKALVLGPTPKESFLISTLVNALSK